MTVVKEISQVHLTDLKPYANTPRTYSKAQIGQIARSIEQFGQTNPILVDAENGVVAGHGRLEAAKELGISEVPVLRLDQMSASDKQAYIIADNKLAENAGWDDALLAVELQGLFDLDVDFDLELTGFDMGEIDIIIGQNKEPEKDAVPKLDKDKQAINQPGDMWFIGPHRLICGDSLERDTWVGLLGTDKAQMVFTDPPYNVRFAVT